MAVVLFVAPHQDDETLAMGASIRKHIESGAHEVHVLLVTDGGNSGAQPVTGLNRPQFTRARDDEFRRACRALGVLPDRIHISRHSAESGALTVQQAEDGIRAFLDEHPDTWLKAYSHRAAAGRHVDHVTTGQAAVNLLTAGAAANLRLYVEPWARTAFVAAHPGVAVSAERPADPDRVRAALDEYSDVDHVGGRYGIGYVSVPSYVDAARVDPVSYYHLP